MAEATALRNNALEYPIYGEPYTVVFPMLDADGDLVTGATTPDAEVSKNGDTFTDCTNESTEIATGSGMYYLTLTATEMTADIVAIIAKSASTGMKTTPIVLYPRKLPQIRTGTCAGGDTGYVTLDSSASAIDDFYNGCVVSCVIDSVREVRVITDYTGSNKQASVTPSWNTAPDSDDTFIVYATDMRAFLDGYATTVSGTVDANVVQISGDSTAADNAESFFDGTGYAGGTTKLGVDIVLISGDSTAADNCELMFDGTGYAGGSTKLQVDMTAISGDTTAADNLESQYDGTGYNTPTAPATKADVRAIAVVEEYLPQYHADSAVSIGDVTGQIAEADITKISTHDGNTYTIGESGVGIGIDAILRFSGMEDYDKPLSVEIDGYYSGSASHWVNVLAYNYITSGYELLHTAAAANAISNGSAERHYSFPLTAAHFDNANGVSLIRFQHYNLGNNAHTGLILNKVVLNFAKMETGTIQDVLDALAGTIDANLVQIDGTATATNQAVLNLKKLVIYNDGNTPAVDISTAVGSANTVNIRNQSLGKALNITNADQNDATVYIENGEIVGPALEIYGAPGVLLEGYGAYPAVQIVPGATANGVDISGGATSGDGINITTTDGHGISVDGQGASKKDIYAPDSDLGITVDLSTITTLLGTPADTDIATDIANVASSIDFATVTNLIGTPTDTDIATDIANLAAQVSAIDGSFGGSGSQECEFTITDTSGNPVGTADIWITSDEAGAVVVAGTLQTNASGIVTFYLDPGTYYRWAQKDGFNFTNPFEFTVT